MNHGVHCIEPGHECPDCSCPCDTGHHHCSCRKSERAHQLIDQLCSDACCDRIHAARKLGYRFNADFCCDPEVLSALVRALLGDPCWEVRRAAAWSITLQKARNDEGVLALYISSNMDPHFLVREKAKESLDILLVCRKGCFRDLFATADELIKKLRKAKFKPGAGDASILFNQCCAASGIAVGAAPQGAVSMPQAALPPAAAVSAQPLTPGTVWSESPTR
jgi:hypothetical protein